MSPRPASNGLLFVISAPSGTGKSTVARRLVENIQGLDFSVSYTTRPRRDAERDGLDYHFVSPERFESMVADGAFLEWARVFAHLYGTGEEQTRRILASGRNLLLDIDVQGARLVREADVPSVSVMLLPPDYPTLERRLRSRGSESESSLKGRLTQARTEALDYRFFDFVVVNESLDETSADVASIIRAEPLRCSRGAETVESILATFPP